MNIYLAGTVTRKYVVREYVKGYIAGPHADYGNIWKDNKESPEKAMNIYLAETFPCDAKQKGLIAKNMNIYLAESGGCHKTYTEPDGALRQRISILESFFYIEDWMLPYIKNYWNFLLDSGAFTFLKQKSDIDWEAYTERYCEFIIENDIDLFFEMDIDAIIGLNRVEQLRSKIEQRTGKQPIPVFHRSRGKQYFLDMCKDYPYVALGGIAIRNIKRSEYKFFPWFIDTAHEYGTKIHGLGFTNLKLLPTYHFDSVDSTTWVFGNITGKIYKFTGKTIILQTVKPGQRIKTREGAIHNFKEWVKFQKYAEVHL